MLIPVFFYPLHRLFTSLWICQSANHGQDCQLIHVFYFHLDFCLLQTGSTYRQISKVIYSNSFTFICKHTYIEHKVSRSFHIFSQHYTGNESCTCSMSLYHFICHKSDTVTEKYSKRFASVSHRKTDKHKYIWWKLLSHNEKGKC